MPQAQVAVGTQLRDALSKDGRVSLVNSPEAADATLEVVITGYHRDVAAVREVDTGLASKFSLTLRVSCTLHDNRANRPFFENRRSSGPARRLHRQRPTLFLRGRRPAAGRIQHQCRSWPSRSPTRSAHTVLDVW